MITSYHDAGVRTKLVAIVVTVLRTSAREKGGIDHHIIYKLLNLLIIQK